MCSDVNIPVNCKSTSFFFINRGVACGFLRRLSLSPHPSSTAQKMHLSFFTLIALFALAAVRAVPAGQPSEVPSCTYTCPPQDEASFPLGENRNDGTTLICSYPAFASENPIDFFCEYSFVSLSPVSASLTSADQARIYLNRPPAHSRRITTQAFVPIQRLPLAPPAVVMRSRNLRPLQRKVRAQLKKRQARIPSSSSTGSLNLLTEYFGITAFIVVTLFRYQSLWILFMLSKCR